MFDMTLDYLRRAAEFLKGLPPLWESTSAESLDGGTLLVKARQADRLNHIYQHRQLPLLRQFIPDKAIQDIVVDHNGRISPSDRLVIGRYVANLEDVLDPEDIQGIVDSTLRLYDRTRVFSGERTDPIDRGAPKLFTRMDDGRCKSVTYPIQSLSSKTYNPLLVIGQQFPHYKTGEDGLFRAILLEHKDDKSRYLLIRYHAVPDSGIVPMVRAEFETNCAVYAIQHPNLGFSTTGHHCSK